MPIWLPGENDHKGDYTLSGVFCYTVEAPAACEFGKSSQDNVECSSLKLQGLSSTRLSELCVVLLLLCQL